MKNKKQNRKIWLPAWKKKSALDIIRGRWDNKIISCSEICYNFKRKKEFQVCFTVKANKLFGFYWRNYKAKIFFCVDHIASDHQICSGIHVRILPLSSIIRKVKHYYDEDIQWRKLCRKIKMHSLPDIKNKPNNYHNCFVSQYH